MKFDVFLPSLLVSPAWFADAAAPRLPAIETLLARGVSRIGGEWPDVLLPAFGIADAAHSQPIAALTAHGDDIDVGIHGWMFAEPAHFQADRDTINLFSSSSLDITTSETTQLIAALNANFSDRGLTFSAGPSGHWYVCCAEEELPQTTSIRAAQRGAVFEKLPQSRGKLSWKSIQNEAQMLFHSHPVNGTRETAGKLTINGLWFWGEGALPIISADWKPSIGAVFGDTPLARGIAKLSNVQFALLAQVATDKAVSFAAHNALLIDTLVGCHEQGDINGWREAALQLDSQIFAPLLASLRTGAVDEIILTLPQDRDSLIVTTNMQSMHGISSWWKNMMQKPRPFLASANA